MKVIVYSAKPYDIEYLDAANAEQSYEFQYIEEPLNEETAAIAQEAKAVCLFVNDNACARVLDKLHENGVEMIALRCAGYNNVDIEHARALKMQVMNVPAYSPYAVAEHAVALMLALNRGIHIAHQRIQQGNFSLQDLIGFDIHGKTVGIIGVGKIGSIVARILSGFGCQMLASDPYVNAECEAMGVKFVPLDELLAQSDIISLHAPLIKSTHYIINEHTIAKMKPGVMLINTSRGQLVKTCDVIDGLEEGRIGYFGLDVYENEGGLFFCDHSHELIHDECLLHLKRFPNVLMTGHQAFFTREAMTNIANGTIENLVAFQKGIHSESTLT